MKRQKKIHIPMLRFIVILIVVAMFVTIGILQPAYYKPQNLLTIVNSIPGRGILAFGFTFVLISGGIDLSVGYGMTLTIMMMGVALNAGLSAFVACIIAILTGLAIGVINGLLITMTQIPPFIVTLATMEGCQGLVNLLFIPNIKLKQSIFQAIGYGTIGNVPISVLIMVACFLLALLLLKHTKMGTYTYAIGSNKKNARVAGLNVRLYETLVYVISGLCMGISGIIFSSRVATIQKTTGGNGVLMDVVTAAVLGGNVVAGEGGILGSMIGIVLLQMLSSALVLFNVSGDIQDVIKGALIITGLVIINVMKKHQSSSAALIKGVKK